MKKSILATAIAVAALILAACGNSDDNTAATTTFNQADVTFAQQMIPHHRQAVEMAELADSKTQSPEVKALAVDIKDAQGPEIKTMTDWLNEWSEPVPDDMAGMDHGDSMPGMMSTQEMDKLKAMSGKEFDEAFLTMMIGHHEGTVEMAQTELEDGKSLDAIELAEEVQSTQKAEIDTMKKQLKR